jgi:hypothetical protein
LVYGSLFSSYLPRSTERWPTLDTDLNVLPNTFWLTGAQELAGTDDLLSQALTALALGHLGQGDNIREEFLHESRTKYVEAVGGLNRALSNKKGPTLLDDSTLATVLALSYCEIDSFDTPYFMGYTEFSQNVKGVYPLQSRTKGYFSHIRGASALVKLRGDGNFSTPLAKKLFLGSRLSDVCLNLHFLLSRILTD